MQDIIIAIDGYSGCGKSSTAKEVAKCMNYTYIDTGAMYRAVTLYFLENYVTLTNDKEVQQALDQIQIAFRKDECGQNQTYLNGLNVENKIRSLEVSNKVSEVSAIPAVRHALVAQQQRMGEKRGVVMDGRDIGTVVFPDAQLKIFMTADPQVRAERRQKELMERGQMEALEDILANLKKRDLIDSTRKESPLQKAPDAYVVDTTSLTPEEQADIICQLAKSIVARNQQRHA